MTVSGEGNTADLGGPMDKTHTAWRISESKEELNGN